MKKARAFLLTLAVAGTAIGCTTVQVAWYRCGEKTFIGWDYERECLRLTGAIR